MMRPKVFHGTNSITFANSVLPTFNHLVGCAEDQLHLVFRELAPIMIYQRGRLLKKGECTDQLGRHAIFADCEVM